MKNAFDLLGDDGADASVIAAKLASQRAEAQKKAAAEARKAKADAAAGKWLRRGSGGGAPGRKPFPPKPFGLLPLFMS